MLRPLRDAQINVHYLYPYIGRIKDNAILILGVDKIDEALQILTQNWVHLISERKLYTL